MLKKLFPVVTSVFVVYLVIGLALPVIPLHVHGDLHLSNLVVGLVSGAQFAAALISRFWSGNYSDKHGGKKALTVGLIVAAVSGGIYWLSLQLVSSPGISAFVLIVGRAILGAAESAIISGALVWGFTIAGAKHAGKVMSWVGTAMYLAFALGAPLGTQLYNKFGFSIIAIATAIIPLITILIVLPREADRPKAPVEKLPLSKVMNVVWKPGVGLAFSSLGFGAITTFLVLLFHQQSWPLAWLGLTIFAVLFVLVRIAFGHLADRVGGAKIAMIFAVIECVGLALIWLASTPAIAFVGAGVTGLGYSLVYPGFGVEAIRRAAPESRGLAIGTYSAFLDLALGLANPALGLIADRMSLKSVYSISAMSVFISSVIGFWLYQNTRRT